MYLTIWEFKPDVAVMMRIGAKSFKKESRCIQDLKRNRLYVYKDPKWETMSRNDNKQYLMHPSDLAVDGVVHRTSACSALMARHVHTHQMHVCRKELEMWKSTSFSFHNWK